MAFNWEKLLDPEQGGPGEVPGRAEAVAAARELSEGKAKRVKRGKRKR
tara:strand:- start:225 stop:368 length:144 start_codon:yes stop_codon:yes gene_type:complete